MKILNYTVIIFLITIIFEALVISIANTSMPNHVVFDLIQNWALMLHLMDSNPIVALKLLFIHNPIVTIQKTDISTGSEIWGIYIMPLTVITLMVVSVYVSRIFMQVLEQGKGLLLILAMMLISVSVLYIRVAACCNASSSWVLDVAILSRVFNPELDMTYWQDIYIAVSPWFQALQMLMVLSGAAILYQLHRQK